MHMFSPAIIGPHDAIERQGNRRGGGFMTFQWLKRLLKITGVALIDDGRDDTNRYYEGYGQYLKYGEDHSHSSGQLHTVAVDQHEDNCKGNNDNNCKIVIIGTL